MNTNKRIIVLNITKMVLIEPEFEIDEKNRVICKFHSDYIQFIDPCKDYFEDIYLDKLLTCLTCSHYINDECYFNKSRIDEIEYKRQKKKGYKCQLCRKRIERMFTVVYKLYNKEAYDIEIPLICCSCYDKVSNNIFLSELKKLNFLYLFIILTSLFFLFFFNFFLILLNLQPIVRLLLSIPYIILIVAVIFCSLLKLKNNISGIKTFKKILPKGMKQK